MRLLTVFSLLAAAAASAEHNVSPTPDHTAENQLYAPDITVIEANKSYVVKLDCPGCPFAVKENDSLLLWEQPPRANALRLEFTVDSKHHPEPALLLNGRSILPLEAMPLNIYAWQLPANVTSDDMKALEQVPASWGMQLPLKYQYTALRTRKSGQLTIQFDVTGLPLETMGQENVKSMELQSEEQKLVQILLRQTNHTEEVFIEDIQVVARKDRAQPFRMRCGRLAMMQTSFDPAEWDEYGRIGSWSRLQNVVISNIGEFWHGSVQNNPLLLPIALFLVFIVVMLRRTQQYRQGANLEMEDDAELALLDNDYIDAPPAYADIPVIKIENYD